MRATEALANKESENTEEPKSSGSQKSSFRMALEIDASLSAMQ